MPDTPDASRYTAVPAATLASKALINPGSPQRATNSNNYESAASVGRSTPGMGARTRSYSRDEKIHQSYAGMMQSVDGSRKEGYSEK